MEKQKNKVKVNPVTALATKIANMGPSEFERMLVIPALLLKDMEFKKKWIETHKKAIAKVVDRKIIFICQEVFKIYDEEKAERKKKRTVKK